MARCIFPLTFTATVMLTVNVLPFVILAVLLTDAVPSNEVSGEYYMQERLSNFKELLTENSCSCLDDNAFFCTGIL